MVQARRLLRDPHPRLLRRQRRRLGRLPRPDREARLPRSGSASTASGCCRCTPSPLRDGGYDIADFYAIHPDYGTVDDFRALDRGRARARHPRDRRPRHEPHLERPPVVPGVALEPGLARSATGTCGRTPTTATRTRGSSSSTPRRRTGRGTRSPAQYYWHRFFSHQPDLNYDNPEVQEAMLDVLRFWLDLGLDGFRLDAVPYLFEREGTNCENLPETHAYLKRVRARDRRRATPTACCSPRPTSGRPTSSSTSATATSATWRSTSR